LVTEVLRSSTEFRLAPQVAAFDVSANGRLWVFGDRRGDESVNQHDPHEQVAGSPQPPILHFGVRVFSNKETLDEVLFTGAHLPLTGASTVTAGRDPDAIGFGDVKPRGQQFGPLLDLEIPNLQLPGLGAALQI
jgi:hypothetical protein